MKSEDCGKLIKAANNPPKIREGSGRRYKDQTGEVRMMSCGQTATIVAYRDNTDIDIQFEDGAIVYNKSYTSFTQGYIKHPDPDKCFWKQQNDAHAAAHIGETKIMNNGLRATIIDYKGRYDVDIEFEDGEIIRGICYSSWVKGESTHSTVKTPRAPRKPVEELIGQTNEMSNGMTATIVDARCASDIDVQFEDGEIATHKTFSAFKTGNICHPSRKGGRLGEKNIMNNGMECTIIAYRTARDIDIRFADGTELYGKDYNAFKRGSIRNPNVVSKKESKKKDTSKATQEEVETTNDKTPVEIADENLQIWRELCSGQGLNTEPSQEEPQEESSQEQIELSDTNKELLFEASITHLRGPTYCYYVEKDDTNYYFKYGVSMLGVQINREEHNRLSITIHDKQEYEEFKLELLKQAKQYRWIGVGQKYSGYFNFLDEQVSHPCNMDGTKFKISLHTVLKQYFVNPAQKLIEIEQYNNIDKFEVNTRPHTVAHDIRLKGPAYLMEPDIQELSDSQILFQFLDISKDTNVVQDRKHTYSAKREQYDLMREALFINTLKMYPRQMIVVDGWTAKDLIESKQCDLIDAYDILTNLRTNPEDGHEQLRRLLYHNYDKLFDKELNRKYQEQRDAEAQKEESAKQKDRQIDNDNDCIDLPIDKMIDSLTAEAHNRFLSQYTAPLIQEELKQYIIGQDELVKRVATFVYYHVLRQIRPNLDIRPLLISGPSGSGKTEVWRVAKKLYADYVHIEIVDGSSITQDGWSGQRKLASVLKTLNTASILVVDEFDKLATPSFTKGGDNVSQRIQSEFLKLLEGDYTTIGYRNDDGSASINYNANTLGIVMIGAFERIRGDKESDNETVGFIRHQNKEYDRCVQITDNDLIDFGVLPEIVGRISDKCTTNKLNTQQYLEIIKNQHSKARTLMNEMETLGISAEQVITDDKIIELAQQSQSNMMGVRWVSSQIEAILLELLTSVDLRNQFTPKQEKEKKEEKTRFLTMEELENTFF